MSRCAFTSAGSPRRTTYTWQRWYHSGIFGYAPKTVDHTHDVLSAVLRTAVNWGHAAENAAHGVELPAIRTVRPKPVLTVEQVLALLQALPLLSKTMVGLATLTGLRRGELFALGWKDIDLTGRRLSVREAVYEGQFGTPKTAAGTRQVPLSDSAVALLEAWKQKTRRAGSDDLVFSTRSGKPISPNNVLRRWVFPACETLKLPRATWLTFRRTFSSWSHERGVPGKAIAELMGHAKVDTTLNVYAQTMPTALREATDKIGSELFAIVRKVAVQPQEGSELIH